MSPSPGDETSARPDDDSDEVADWFSTETDPAIAQAVAKAEAEARAPVAGTLDAPRQYPPLSQQAQPPATDYAQQPPVPRHGAPDQ